MMVLMEGKHRIIKGCRLIIKFHSESLRQIGTFNLRFSRRTGKFGKRPDSANFLKLTNSFYYKLLFNTVTTNSFKNSKKGNHEQIQLSWKIVRSGGIRLR